MYDHPNLDILSQALRRALGVAPVSSGYHPGMFPMPHTMPSPHQALDWGNAVQSVHPQAQPQNLGNPNFDEYRPPPLWGNTLESFAARQGDNAIDTGQPTPVPQRPSAGPAPTGFNPAAAALGRAAMPSPSLRRWS